MGEAGDGHAALASLRTFVPDLIFLDLAMLGMHGWDLYDALQRDPLRALIPIALLCDGARTADGTDASTSQADRSPNAAPAPLRARTAGDTVERTVLTRRCVMDSWRRASRPPSGEQLRQERYRRSTARSRA